MSRSWMALKARCWNSHHPQPGRSEMSILSFAFRIVPLLVAIRLRGDPEPAPFARTSLFFGLVFLCGGAWKKERESVTQGQSSFHPAR